MNIRKDVGAVSVDDCGELVANKHNEPSWSIEKLTVTENGRSWGIRRHSDRTLLNPKFYHYNDALKFLNLLLGPLHGEDDHRR